MKEILTLSLLLFSINIFSQDSFDSTKISFGLMEIVNKVAMSNSNSSGDIGYSRNEKITLSPQEELQAKGTTRDFLELTKHPSISVRYIAISEVADKVDTFNFTSYILNSFRKSEIINWSSSSLIGANNFSDYLISLFNSKITSNQRYIIDSVLFFDYVEDYYFHQKEKNNPMSQQVMAGPIEYRDKLILNLKPEEQYYKRLKSLYSIEDNPVLIYAISKYAKPEDSIYIIDGLSSNYYHSFYLSKRQTFWCYRAIYENPKNYYFKYLTKASERFPEIENYRDDYERYMYYLALTKYRNAGTLDILSKMVGLNEDLTLRMEGPMIWLVLQKTKGDYFKSIIELVHITPEEKTRITDFISDYDRFLSSRTD